MTEPIQQPNRDHGGSDALEHKSLEFLSDPPKPIIFDPEPGGGMPGQDGDPSQPAESSTGPEGG